MAMDIQKRIKKRRRRFKFLMFVIVISAVTIYMFRTPVFKVKSITVTGNNIVSSENIIDLSGIQIGDNLLRLNTNHIKQNILTNPYVEQPQIKRNLLCDVTINVIERKNAAIAVFNNKYVTIDKKGVIIEILDSKEDIKLLLIDGLDIKEVIPGRVVDVWDTKKLNAYYLIFDNITQSDLSDIINEIDIKNILSITLKTKYDINIKLGSLENISKKLEVSKAILNQELIKKGLKGTLDVSYNGNPVFSQE